MSHEPILAEIRSQRLNAVLFFIVGVVFLAASPPVVDRFNGWIPLTVPTFGLFLLWFGRREWRQARNRLHGINLEHITAMAAVRALLHRGFEVKRGQVMPGRGDIDIVIERAGVCIPIEIKSFHAWSTNEDRCRSALSQAWRQQDHLRAPHAIIWLPDAKVGLWRRWFGHDEGRIRVVFGSARTLARIAAWYA